MSSTSSFKAIAASLLMASSATAHMIMNTPTPYDVGKIQLGPITAETYPCQVQDYQISQMNNMAVGESQTLSFNGSAVHGGGSCQLSITTDQKPTKDSKFKVIKSIEGGCPGVNGPEEFTFELPDSVPDGKVTFAWTWFAKLSGAPEMYMNCAPVTVTGGASDDSKFQELPDMLIANIDGSDCKTPVSGDTKIPNPGSDLQVVDGSNPQAPTGAGCGAAVGGGYGGSSSAEAPVQSSTPVASAPASSAPAGYGAASTPAANQGGVFAPGGSTQTTLLTSTGTATVTATGVPPASTPAASAPASSAPASYGGSATGDASSGGDSNSTCTEDNAIVCNGESKFGICNGGSVVWQDVAPGTTCQDGQVVKRDGGEVLISRSAKGIHRGRFGRRHGTKHL